MHINNGTRGAYLGVLYLSPRSLLGNSRIVLLYLTGMPRQH
jgi:hypothetical protein